MILYRYIGGALIFLLLLGGAYLKGRSDVNELRRADQAAHKVEYDKQVAETARIQGEWDKSRESERVIQERLAVVSAESAGFYRSLRDYKVRLRALSEAARSTGEPDPTAGESSDLERLEGAHFEACARDSQRLTEFQAFYKALQDTQ